jgi:ribonucleoside-diphosphate reductase alpha chain
MVGKKRTVLQIMNNYQQYIALSRYARWLDKESRRETFTETVDRYIAFIYGQAENNTSISETDILELKNVLNTIRDSILGLEVVPSMRALMVAGKAAERCNVSCYNCAYIDLSSVRSFDEIMYVLLSGTGVGFSVERQYINQLPEIAEEFYDTDTIIGVPDSKIGWASSYRELISLLYGGKVPKWDMSKIRPAGSRLKTFGGRACLAGDTKVYRSGKKSRSYLEITINDLVKLKASSGHFNRIKLRSVEEQTGKIYYNKLIDVIDNGISHVYEVSTHNGYKIKATPNHRFMNALGEWVYLNTFNIGDMIAVNGSEKRTGTCVVCGMSISRKAQKCKPCFDKCQIKPDSLGTTARQRKENKEYRKGYCEQCGRENTRFEVHHIDRNPHNNVHNNLLNLCSKCHQELHARERTLGDGFSHKYMSWDEIVSIVKVGEERVYDLSMEGPNHNFIANGFVSHNSGPEPLIDLFNFTVGVFKNARGRKLNSIECHDLVCKIADVVVVGGVRRSALLSLSNLTDERMRNAKTGRWWDENAQRALSNNSVCYTEKPDNGIFLKEWLSLYESKSGERGIFNRVAAKKIAARNGRRDQDHNFGTNPCSEIILRSKQFCNLSEVVVRPSDTLDILKEKVRKATILGTLQSTLTNFKYLSKKWKENTEEERLLGVSLTGIMDHPILSNPKALYIESGSGEGIKSLPEILEELKNVAIETNAEWATKLNISPSTAVTAVKPSGTVSQLVDSASGIHPRYSRYYIRTVRSDKKDPIYQFLKDQGVPVEDAIGKENTTAVFSFPQKAPEGSVMRDDMTALEQLELWKVYAEFWCEHKPSITVYVREHEWMEVGAWVYRNFDLLSGVAFLPHTDHVYKQAPYSECTEEEYNEAIKSFPKDIDWSKLSSYETEDTTTVSHELACSASGCDIV